MTQPPHRPARRSPAAPAPSTGAEGWARPTRRDALAAGAWTALALAGTGCRAGGAAGDPRAAPADRAPTDARASEARGADLAAREAERFAHLVDPRPPIAPISPAERAARRSRAAAALARAGSDALLVEPGPALSYFAGVPWGRSERLFALLIFADGACAFVAPAFEETRARARIDAAIPPEANGGRAVEILTWQEDEYPWPVLERAFAARRVERVLLDRDVRHGFADRLATTLGPARVASGAALVASLRMRKDEHELALLRRANELTQRAIVAVSETLEPGLASRAIAARLDAAHVALGLRSPWCLALIGPAAALPHGDGDARTLARGDVLLVDTGASYQDYQSDITRTWVFGGGADAEVRSIWGHVRDAQRAALAAIRPGVRAREIDAAARASIERSGFGPGYRHFTHRLGHGIGLEGHEDPYFDGGSDVVLEPGMTLSNEPGIYLPFRFGVRIEDVVAVTADGVESFGSPQASVESPA